MLNAFLMDLAGGVKTMKPCKWWKHCGSRISWELCVSRTFGNWRPANFYLNKCVSVCVCAWSISIWFKVGSRSHGIFAYVGYEEERLINFYRLWKSGVVRIIRINYNKSAGCLPWCESISFSTLSVKADFFCPLKSFSRKFSLSPIASPSHPATDFYPHWCVHSQSISPSRLFCNVHERALLYT